jgi:hypothetical protein
MSTNFPTSLDTYTNPSGGDLVSASVGNRTHSQFHADNNDAIEALQAKVGADSSAVTTSHDYKLSEVTGSDKAVGKSATQTLTNKTLTAPTITGLDIQDTQLLISDNSDTTKKVNFQVSGVTTGTTRTMTIPDENTTLVGTAATQTITNKSINASNNTITNLTTTMFATNVVDTDTALAANSDSRIPTQKAVKAYADAVAAGGTDKVVKTATAGVSFTGATTPVAVVYGDGNSYGTYTTHTGSNATLGNVSGATKIAQKLIVNSSTAIPLTGITVRAQKSGSPVDQVTCSIQADSGGVPSGTAIVSATQTIGAVGDYTFNLTASLANGTYWVVFERTGSVNASDYYTFIGASTAAALYTYNGSAWQTWFAQFATVNISLEVTGVVTFTAGHVYGATSGSTLFTNGLDAVSTPSFLQACDGIVNTTVSQGNSVNVISDGYATGFSLTAGNAVNVQADSTLGTSGSIKVGRMVSSGTLFIKRY